MQADELYLELIVFRPCVLIPVYNHERAIGEVVRGVLAHNVPCLLVDDGSSPGCAAVLDQIAADAPTQVMLLRHRDNEGKGRAVLTGIYHAARKGYSHVLQIDADGQHCIDDIPHFLDESSINPAALIVGCPIYDESVPPIRLYGRYLTHVWVWINTLSTHIKDSMCGFRIYPVMPVLNLMQRHKLGARMTFDTEVLVRMFWEGSAVVNMPTRVSYPKDGVSHFRALSDNVQISWMHATLFLGMLRRLPKLLKNKRDKGNK